MSDTGTITLTDFLLARIAEDEADAQDALERGFGGWEYFADRGVNHEARSHIVRWHPARVLAECEAKRRIVELHASTMGQQWCRSCGRADLPNAAHEWPCLTILELSTIYADHADYREEWKP